MKCFLKRVVENTQMTMIGKYYHLVSNNLLRISTCCQIVFLAQQCLLTNTPHMVFGKTFSALPPYSISEKKRNPLH